MTREEQIYKKAEGDCIAMLESIERGDIIKGSICPQSYRAGFMDGAKWADQYPQWIPVEERRPKFDEQVLVYGLCPDGCRLFYVDCLIQDINDNGYPKWDDDTIIPTHWMPIVPPRKED